MPYCSAAWAIENEQQDIEVVSTWPGAGNSKSDRYRRISKDIRAKIILGTSVKLPTVVAFSESRFLWGWQALSSSKEPIRGVKLLLDEHQSHRYDPSLRAKKMLSSMGRSPIEVSAEYLKKVIEQVQHNLERRFGPAVKDMSKKYVLTVPAVWTDKAKDATMKVAIGAGLKQNQLSLLSEPEAAALYTLRSIQPNTIKVCTCQHTLQHDAVINNNPLTQKDDTFIVCDAGGGTVV